MSTAYSKTPLAKKLGIKEGFIVQIIGEPDYYFELFESLPESLTYSDQEDNLKDFIHLFSDSAAELDMLLGRARYQIQQNGMIWVSWPKKASKVPTDITEDVVREKAFQFGLVDVKVCAVDAVWSGLKLMIPVKDRKK